MVLKYLSHSRVTGLRSPLKVANVILYFSIAVFDSCFSKDLLMFCLFFKFHKGVNSECNPSGSIDSHSVSILLLQREVSVNISCTV